MYGLLLPLRNLFLSFQVLLASLPVCIYLSTQSPGLFPEFLFALKKQQRRHVMV